MAKHSKKNNIISYDDAKLKKIHDRQDDAINGGRHYRDDELYSNDEQYSRFDGNVDAPITHKKNPKQDRDRIKAKRYKQDNYDTHIDRDYIEQESPARENRNRNEERSTPSTRRYSDDKYDTQKQYANNRYSFSRKRNYNEVARHLHDEAYYEDEQDDYEYEERTPRSQPISDKANNFVKLSIVGVMVLILAFFGVMLYDYYIVETITVIGNENFKYYDIAQLSGVEYKQSMLSVSAEDIKLSIETQKPMIKVVDVNKLLPNTLEIIVKERSPVCFLVLKGSQKCAIIGENNVCLDIVDSYLKDDIPRIYGVDIGDCELGALLSDGEVRKITALKEIISAMIETNCISEIESININNTTNITMMSTSGTNIKIGDTSSLSNKFMCIKTMLNHLDGTENIGKSMVVTGDNAIYIE